MVCYANGSTSRLSYIKEVTRGTTPTGDFTLLPPTTYNLELSKEGIPDPTLYGDRMERHYRHGNSSVAGEIAAVMRADNYDDLIAGALMSTWDTSPSSADDELKVGATLQTFTFEDYDSTIDISRLFNGCAINTFNMTTTPGQNVDISFGIVGFDNPAATGAEKTVAATTVNEPFDNYSGSIQIGNTGSSLSNLETVTAFEFTVNNSLNPVFHIGNQSPDCFEYGIADISGQITVHYKVAAEIARFRNETETALSFSVDDTSNANTYTILFPRVKFLQASVPVEGSQSRVVTLPFKALKDGVENSPIIIYRPETA